MGRFASEKMAVNCQTLFLFTQLVVCMGKRGHLPFVLVKVTGLLPALGKRP